MSERRTLDPEAASETFTAAILAGGARIHKRERRRRRAVGGFLAAACAVLCFGAGVLAASRPSAPRDQVAAAPPQQIEAPTPTASTPVAPDSVAVDAAGISAVVRNGTVSVRIPAEWLEAHAPDATAAKDSAETELLSGEAAQAALCALTDRETAEALAVVDAAFGQAEGTLSLARVREIDGVAKVLCMRRIGADWYTLVRLAETPGADAAMTIAIEQLDFALHGEVLEVARTPLSLGLADVPIVNRDGLEAAYRASVDGLRLSLYETDGTCIAVVTEPGSAETADTPAWLYIDRQIRTAAQGYADGDSTIYCIPLSEEEAEAIKGGASFSVERNAG